MGRGSYACWGSLVPVVSTRAAGVAIDYVDNATFVVSSQRRAQDVALERLRQVQRAADKKLGNIADISKSLQRALKTLDKLRRKAEMLEVKSRMTDEQVEAERSKRKQKAEERRSRSGERSVALGRAAFER